MRCRLTFSTVLLSLCLSAAATDLRYQCGPYFALIGDRSPRALRILTHGNKTVREYAAEIYAGIKAHGQFTEVGAHGEGISWKFIGLYPETIDGVTTYKIVGYGNFQDYRVPYNELAREGKVLQIAVASNFNKEMFVDLKDLSGVPEATRKDIAKAIRLAVDVDRIRYFSEKERPVLWEKGTLPKVEGAISIVPRAGVKPGEKAEKEESEVSILSIADEGTAGNSQDGRVPFKFDPSEPVIVGIPTGLVPEYLDPAYQITRLKPEDPAAKKKPKNERDKYVSRAHFMLEADPELGIYVVNGVPHPTDGLRAPTNGTKIQEPGKAEREMEPGEKVLIRKGRSAVVTLPNHNKLLIEAAK